MNFAKVSNKVTSHFIMDPYTSLFHYRRTFRMLKGMSSSQAKVLIIGHKNQSGIDWKSNFEGITLSRGRIDESVLSSASNFYDLIVCLDAPLYAPYLKGINLPVVGVCSTKELHDHPELVTVIDYLLPAATGRTDAAIRQLMLKSFVDADKNSPSSTGKHAVKVPIAYLPMPSKAL
eukprot:GDKJ01022563.1.p1 GENE.GDKJ01022563.1~~GDKJ01022563.1.p1  ORF type:complete len:176 (-),score=23.17 GDKJ01022563.1:39-566(-)